MYLQYLSEHGIVTIYKGCDTEDDREVGQVLQTGSICYTIQVSANCNVSCQGSESSVNLTCYNKQNGLSRGNNTFLEGWKIQGQPGKCNEVAVETCSCTSDFCNNKLT